MSENERLAYEFLKCYLNDDQLVEGWRRNNDPRWTRAVRWFQHYRRNAASEQKGPRGEMSEALEERYEIGPGDTWPQECIYEACIYEARTKDGNMGTVHAWCQTHGFDCPNMRSLGQESRNQQSTQIGGGAGGMGDSGGT